MFILVVQFVYPWLCLAYRLLSHVFLSVKAMCSCVIAVESSRMSCAYISDVISVWPSWPLHLIFNCQLNAAI